MNPGAARLREAYARAARSINLRARVRDAIVTSGAADGLDDTVRIVAIGKSTGAMVDGALDALGARVEAALAILPDDSPAPRTDPRVRVLRASHPLPDARSVAAGEAALAFDATLALVSGGASSLAFAPHGTLEHARAALSALLTSGADVRAINTVRRHASRVHGGALGPIRTFLASDVIDGAPHDIGSGPTVADPTTLDDARAVLAQWARDHAALLVLAETRKPSANEPTARIVIEPSDLARALARELGVAHDPRAARVLPASTGDVNTLARDTLTLAHAMSSGDVLTRSAEPSLRIASCAPGAGGRCTHLAALVARDLPPGVTFLAAASDGVDGTSGTAGAVVDAFSFSDRAPLDAAIATFDTGPLHLTAGTALAGGPTGLNLTDVLALLKE